MTEYSKNPRESTKAKMRKFADLWRGGPDGVRGNQKACWLRMHPNASPKSAEVRGSEYLNHPYTQGYLAKKAAEVTERANITEQFVLDTIRDTIERCSQAKPVMRAGQPVMVETESGELAPAYTFDATNVLKGSELLGKYLKMWTDKLDVDADVRQRFVVSSKPLSEDEWLEKHTKK